MPISKFLYFGDFLAIPAVVAVLTYSALAPGGLWAAPDFGVSLLIGLATWTLVEYAIHRFVYHHAPLFSALHDSHHRAPNEFIGVPSFVSSGFIIVLCFPCKNLRRRRRQWIHRRDVAGLRRLYVHPSRDPSFRDPAGRLALQGAAAPYDASLSRQRQFRSQHRLLGPGFRHHGRKAKSFRELQSVSPR